MDHTSTKIKKTLKTSKKNLLQKSNISKSNENLVAEGHRRTIHFIRKSGYLEEPKVAGLRNGHTSDEETIPVTDSIETDR